MIRFLLASVVAFGVYSLWGMLHLPAWAPVTVMGHGVALRLVVALVVAASAWGKMSRK